MARRGEPFTRNFSPPESEFPWELYLAGTTWGQAMHLTGVASFWLVWVGGAYWRRGFNVQYGQPSIERVIFPDRGRADEEPVSFIWWHV